MDWFVHLKQNDNFGSVDPDKTLTTISEAERREVADVSLTIFLNRTCINSVKITKRREGWRGVVILWSNKNIITTK